MQCSGVPIPIQSAKSASARSRWPSIRLHWQVRSIRGPITARQPNSAPFPLDSPHSARSVTEMSFAYYGIAIHRTSGHHDHVASGSQLKWELHLGSWNRIPTSAGRSTSSPSAEYYQDLPTRSHHNSSFGSCHLVAWQLPTFKLSSAALQSTVCVRTIHYEALIGSSLRPRHWLIPN